MSTELSPALREQIENTIRGLTIDAVERAGIGHLGEHVRVTAHDVDPVDRSGAPGTES